MNNESDDTLTIKLTGVLTIERAELEQVLARLFQSSHASSTPRLN